jgi:hypothetical protein
MSLLDQLKNLEADVAKRLRELEPAVREYSELEKVAQRLGIERNADRAAQGAARRSGSSAGRDRRRSGQRSGASAKKSPGRRSKRADDIYELVQANPGITVAQLGKRLRVDPTGLYAPVRRLQQEGRIEKDGPNLQPVQR